MTTPKRTRAFYILLHTHGPGFSQDTSRELTARLWILYDRGPSILKRNTAPRLLNNMAAESHHQLGLPWGLGGTGAITDESVTAAFSRPTPEISGRQRRHPGMHRIN